MDSKLVNEKAALFGDRSVRINPAVMKQLGLEKQGNHLKIGEFVVSCVPFDLALGKASLLAFLSAKETAFFEAMKGRSQTLNLVGRTGGDSKPVPFFVRCSILAFRKPSPESPYCFIDLTLGEAPFILKEMLVAWFDEVERAELFWKDAPDQSLSPQAIANVFFNPSLALLRDGTVADRLRVVYLSPRKLRLFGEYQGSLPEKGEALDLEARDGEDSIVIRGPCLEAAPFDEATGFAFFAVEPLFNPWLASRMLGYKA